MSDIATEAGIGRATLYRHFNDFDAILVALISREIADLVLKLKEVAASFSSLEDKAIEPMIYWLREAPRIRILQMLFDHDVASLNRLAFYADEFKLLGEDYCALIFEQAVREGRIRKNVTLKEYAEWITRIQLSLRFYSHYDHDDEERNRDFLRKFLIPSLFLPIYNSTS